MQLTRTLTTSAVALLSGAQISLAAPQLQHQSLQERQDGVRLVIQTFPDSNCGVSLEERKFYLDPAAAVFPQTLCIRDTPNSGSIRMIEQPYTYPSVLSRFFSLIGLYDYVNTC